MGLNCPEEKGKEVSSQRTEQGSAAGQRKKLRCLLEYFVMMLIQPFTPILLSIFTPPSPICIYIPNCVAFYYYGFRHSFEFGCILGWHL